MKIFISAVSSQFGECRKALANDLRATGSEVVLQEELQQQGYTLLEKLEKYIAGCDRMVALVGDAYGYEPPPHTVPLGKPRRSFTQWEYAFALGERLVGVQAARKKKLYVYFADQAYLDRHPVAQAEEEAELQRRFIESIWASGQDRSTFDSLDALCRLALRDGFRLRQDGRRRWLIAAGAASVACAGGLSFYRWFPTPDGPSPLPPTYPSRPPVPVPGHDEGQCARTVRAAWDAPASEINRVYGSISVKNDSHRTVNVVRYIHSCYGKETGSSDPDSQELSMLDDPRGLESIKPGEQRDFEKVLPCYNFLMVQDANTPHGAYRPDREWRSVKPGTSYEATITDEIFQNHDGSGEFRGIAFKTVGH